MDGQLAFAPLLIYIYNRYTSGVLLKISEKNLKKKFIECKMALWQWKSSDTSMYWRNYFRRFLKTLESVDFFVITRVCAIFWHLTPSR